MRLNNSIRERVKIFLIEKAFPKTKEENLMKNLRLTLESSDLLSSRKQIYELYPEYIRGSSRVRFERKTRYSYSGKYDETQTVEASISFTYATKVNEWGCLEVNITTPEFKEKYPLIFNDVLALMEFEKSRTEYRRSVGKVLDVVQSSTPLINLIPECAEFFQTESHGVTSTTSLVPTEELTLIRSYLDAVEKEEVSNE